MNNVVVYIGLVLFFMMTFFGQVDGLLPIKSVLLAIVMLSIIVRIDASKELGIDNRLVLWTLCMGTIGLYFTLEGIIANNPGAMATGRVYVVWPFIYLLLVRGCSDLQIINKIHNTIVLSSFCIAAYGIIYFLVRIGYLPEYLNITNYFQLSSTNVGLDVGIYEGYIKMNTFGINIVPYLMPYLISYYILNDNILSDKHSGSIKLIVSILLMMILAVLSVRKAILLSGIMAIPLTYILVYAKTTIELRHKHIIRNIVMFAVACFIITIILMTIYEYDFTVYIEKIRAGLDFSLSTDNIGAYIRRIQFDALLHGWLNSPILGAGFGASGGPYGWVSSEETPWAYELSYMALLFQVGLVGIIAYFSGILWIYQYGIHVIRNERTLMRFMLPSIVALTCFLVANATNPYLSKFEGLWPIFFSITIINVYLLQESRVRKWN